MKSYLLIFDDTQIDRPSVIEIIDNMPNIVNWYAFFNNAIVIVTKSTAREISKALQDNIPAIRFIVAEIDQTNKGGWLPRSVWQFMNNPKPAGE